MTPPVPTAPSEEQPECLRCEGTGEGRTASVCPECDGTGRELTASEVSAMLHALDDMDNAR